MYKVRYLKKLRFMPFVKLRRFFWKTRENNDTVRKSAEPSKTSKITNVDGIVKLPAAVTSPDQYGNHCHHK